MATLLTLPAIPSTVVPTSGVTATMLAMPVRTMKEKLTSVPCREAGRPNETSLPTYPLWIRKLRGWKSKTKFRLRRKTTEMIRLTAWEAMVAHAAPAEPMCSGPTSTRSSTTLRPAEMATKMSGCLESPIPRSTALTALYPTTNKVPPMQMLR